MADKLQEKNVVAVVVATNVRASATPAVVTAVVNPLQGQVEENSLVPAIIDHLQQPGDKGPHDNAAGLIETTAFEEAFDGEEEEVRKIGRAHV